MQYVLFRCLKEKSNPMKIFGPLYARMIRWSQHPKAEWYLGGVSFAESSFFPIPTSVMLAPMVLARRQNAWRLAALSTVTSVLGGLFGYLIGYLMFEQLGIFILNIYQLEEDFLKMELWFGQHGIWLLFLSGLTPIPYKLFTITSGVMGLAIVPFFFVSLAGRALQFYLVAALVWWGGQNIEPVLEKYIEWFGWGLLVLIVTGYLITRLAG